MYRMYSRKCDNNMFAINDNSIIDAVTTSSETGTADYIVRIYRVNIDIVVHHTQKFIIIKIKYCIRDYVSNINYYTRDINIIFVNGFSLMR